MRFLVFCLSIFFSFIAHSKIEVRVNELSTVRIGDPIRLGVIISGEVENSSLAEKIQNMVVFEPLKTEGIKSFSSQDLAVAIRRKLSFIELQSISMRIPEVIRLRAIHNYLYPSDIRYQIRQRAQSRCGDCDVIFEDLMIPDVSNMGEILSWKLDLTPLKNYASFAVPLILETSKGRHIVHVTGRLGLYQEALVAKRLLRLGEKISPLDVESRKVNIAFAKDGLAQKEQLSGSVANRVISVGQTIFMGDLRKETIVQRGESVKLLIGNDSFEVIFAGIAQEAGSLGDRIRVKSAESNKILTGILVDKAVVRVE